MIKRLNIYFKEMYPLLPRLALGFLLFFEIHLLVILTNGEKVVPQSIGAGEIIGSLTLFAFLLTLRIADDFKDYETDLRLFPSRPLPSGRVRRGDLVAVLFALWLVLIPLNLVFLGNTAFFALLLAYGALMSFWFFQKAKIQKSLPLALVTHNPVQIVMNLYVISYACKLYNIPLLSFNNFVIALTLYFPGLIWEISRKIYAPEDEGEYTTYSKLFGYKKATKFVMAVMLIDFFSTSYLLTKLYTWAPLLVAASYAWLVFECLRFMKNPKRTKLVSRVEIYEYAAEGTVVLLIAAKIFGWF